MEQLAQAGLLPDTCGVSAVTLTQFRNHASLALRPEGRSVVITGANGAGKTNILEAISLFSPGRGLRGAKLAQLKRQDGETAGWAVSLELRQTQLGTGQHPNGGEKRLLRCNGEPLNSQAELTQHLCVLWQTPQMDGVFTEGASEQRRFFDRLVYSFDLEHATRVARYEYYMRERNKLLGDRRMDAAWLGTIEQKMAEASVAVAASRLEVLQHLRVAMQALHPAFPHAEIALTGFAEQALENGMKALEAEERLAAQLAESRRDDAMTGRSSQGAHKMELKAIHHEKQMPAALCSTGEQKALLLSLLLAQTQALATKRKRLPVLLLDEVVAHLDVHRRHALFAALAELGAQAWLTGTDSELFNGYEAERVTLPFPSP